MNEKKILTLCMVYDRRRILLGMKKRGFGRGRWNGFGGKLQKGESIEEAAKRELEEEAGITPAKLEKRGVLDFKFKNSGEKLKVHVFSCSDFSGEPQESEEMKPQWFSLEDIPYGEMWPGDKYWLDLLLDGENFQGSFSFDGQDILLSYCVKEI